MKSIFRYFPEQTDYDFFAIETHHSFLFPIREIMNSRIDLETPLNLPKQREQINSGDRF